MVYNFFFFSSRRRHTRWTGDWSSDVCSSDLPACGRRRLRGGSRLAQPPRPNLSLGQQRCAAGRWSRSEERRVGKEGRSRWAADHLKKKREEARGRIKAEIDGGEGSSRNRSDT